MTGQGKHILFLSFQSINERPVLQSQVLEQIKFLAEEGFRITLLVHEKVTKEKLTYLPALVGGSIEVFVNSTSNPLLRLLTMYRQVSRIIASPVHVDFICYRSIWAGLIAEVVKRSPVQTVFSVRALIAEESAYRNHRKFPNYYVLRMIECVVMRSADRLLAVSQPLKTFILQRVPGKHVAVIPCCVNEKTVRYDAQARADVRTTFGLAQDDVLLVYVGGHSNWQSLNKVTELFDALSQVDHRVYLLLLARASERLKELIHSLGSEAREKVFFKSAPHEEVYRYVSAADVGLLIREEILLNKVAAPVKFAEYLAGGIPVITTPSIEDYSQLVLEYQLGIVLPYDEIASSSGTGGIEDYLEYLRRERETIREHCIETARTQFAWANYKEEFFDVFG